MHMLFRRLLSVLVVAGVFCGILYAQEPETKTSLPIKEMVKAITGQGALADKSFYYDPGFKSVGSFAIHNHFAQRVCLGYLVTDGVTLSYRYIRAWPGLGSSNDAFQTPLSNVAKVEFKYYKASKGVMDAYPERLSTTFYFETPIKGLVADWSKKDIKFDVWDVSFGYTLMGYLKELKIPMKEKD
jgi:hypothetical protein